MRISRFSTIALSFYCLLQAVEVACSQIAHFSVVCTGEYVFRCQLQNTSGKSVHFPSEFLLNDNNIGYITLSPTSGWPDGILGHTGDILGDPPSAILENGKSKVYCASSHDLSLEYFQNEFIRCWWHVGPWRSQSANIGIDGGNLMKPLIDSAPTNTTIALAFVLKQKQPGDMALLYWNRADTTILTDELNDGGGHVIVTSGPIGYSNDLVSVSLVMSNATIAPKSVGLWRIPWPDVWGRIPVEDRQKLEKAGAIDLRWKCGDIVSEPLPLWVGPLDGVTNCPYATGSSPTNNIHPAFINP